MLLAKNKWKGRKRKHGMKLECGSAIRAWNAELIRLELPDLSGDVSDYKIPIIVVYCQKKDESGGLTD
jgi:hypothetical protein